MKRKDIISAVVGLVVIGLAIFVWLGPAGTRMAPDITLTTLKALGVKI